MKKIVSRFSGKGLLVMAAASAFFIAGCNNNDYNKAGETTVVEKDSAMMDHDTAMHSEMPMSSDTTAMAPATTTTMVKDSMSKPVKAKSAKKGKVSIVMTGPVMDKNEPMEMDKEGFYKNTEVLPGYPGGQKALERFFEKNIEYPEAATENDAQGVVKLSFAVDENGKIYQPMATGNKLGYGLEEEAIRVFNKMPKWVPGKIKGKNVKTRFTLPVNFQLY